METDVTKTPNVEHFDRELLSAARLARLLDVSTRTIWRLRSAGKLPRSLEVGGSVRWKVSEIKRWIEMGCPSLDEWDALPKDDP